MESTEMLKCALVYDFDGTLAKDNCAEHGLMPALGITSVSDFWCEVKARAKADDADEILSYMGLLAEKAEQAGADQLSAENLQKHGAVIPLFAGVQEWFDRIDAYAYENNLILEHYIISSGLTEMIRGCKVGHYFKNIFACKYHYSACGNKAMWAAQAVNYTTKTQFLFRINKGIENAWDNPAVNKFIEPKDRAIPFERIIYFGDGDTDIPSMKMVRYQGGYSLAVFDSDKWTDQGTQLKVEKLISEERANYVVSADYSEGSQLDITVKGLLQLIKRKAK